MDIRISIQTTEPLVGTATADAQGSYRFEGWLDLLRVLSVLIAAKTNAEPGIGVNGC